MNIHKIIDNTKVEGPGNRLSIWVQGCSRHCRGCFATDTWNFEAGQRMSVDQIVEIIKNNSSIEGITILGGEPLDQSSELAELISRVRSETRLSIILFTGYEYEAILADQDAAINCILRNVDVLIDGPYIEELRSFSIPLIGSSNQKFRFLSERYSMQDFVKNKIEIRIDPSGKTIINGMIPFE